MRSALVFAISIGLAAQMVHAEDIRGDTFGIELNESGVLIGGPPGGLFTVDGPTVRLEGKITEWVAVRYAIQGIVYTACAAGREPDWAARPPLVPIALESDGRSATAMTALNDLEVTSFLRFSANGAHLLTTVTLRNTGRETMRDVHLMREWRVIDGGWTFPPDHVRWQPPPDDVARIAWMLDDLAPGTSQAVTFAYRSGKEAPIGASEVPLRRWVGPNWPEGVNFGTTAGISIGDYDADGWVDVVAPWGGLLWRNLEGQDWAVAADLDTVLPAAGVRYGAAFGDWNNDGRPDLVTEGRYSCGPCSGDFGCHVVQNLGGGRFVDVTRELVDRPLTPTDAEMVCLGDVDVDGDLDVFIPVYPPEFQGSIGNLFLQNLGADEPGGYRFEEVAESVGVANQPGTSRPEGAQFVDVDNDGDLDLFSNGTLYQNVSSFGAPAFEPMTTAGSGITVNASLDEGAAFADYDLDGDQDLLIAYSSLGIAIWENAGDGTFSWAGPIVEEPLIGLNLGLSVEDWDNDGDLDFTTRQVFRRNMLLETGIRGFVVASTSIPLEHRDSATPAWGDWDRDGDLDCVLGNWLESGRLYENVLYDIDTPSDARRYVRIRCLEDSDDVPAGLETAYGAIAEIVIDGDPIGMRRKKFVASGHGYLNQNEYTLHFGLPADPAPGDPAEDLRFDVIVDFPSLPEDGVWRVDKFVNDALGDVNLASLGEREIMVFRSGRVIRDGVGIEPTGRSPRLTTAGGGLIMPDPRSPLALLLGSGPNTYVGLDFDTLGATRRVQLKETILDASLAPAADCPAGNGNLRLWDVTDPVGPTLVAVADEGHVPVSFERNRRRSFRTAVLLERDRQYRMVACVQGYRPTPIQGPVAHDQLTVRGGLLFIDDEPCAGENVAAAPLQAGRIYLTVRFGPANVVADLDDDGIVGFADLVTLLGAWGPCPVPPGTCGADLDGDGLVGFTDLSQLLAAWTT